MKTWFQSLERREQRTLTIGAVLLVIIAIVYTSLELNQSNLELRTQLAQQQGTLLQMRQQADQVRQLRGAGDGQSRTNTNESLLAAVDRTSKSADLSQAVKRVQPEGSNGVRVWLEAGEFNRVVSWIDTLLTTQGAQLKGATFERAERAGFINARLTFERSES